MKCIIIKCYFTDSEDFIKEMIGECDIECKKIPNTREDLGLWTMYTEWFLKGDENLIDNLIISIENKDYDVEIITDAVEMIRIILHS